jgi:hypothetical protein
VYYAAEKLLGGVAFPHSPRDKKKALTADVILGKSCVVLLRKKITDAVSVSLYGGPPCP